MTRATLVVLALLAGVGSQPAASTEPTALKIVNKSFDAESGKITFDLLNTSEKIITAWRLSEVFSADGRLGPEVLTATDAYSCLHHPITHPGPPRDREELERCGLIFPGQRVATEKLVTPMPSGGYPVVSLKVVGIVYEDVSYEGDPAVAAEFFAARAAGLEEVSRHLEIMRSLESAELSTDDLLERMGSWVLTLRGEGNDAAIASGMPAEAVMSLSATRRSAAEQLEIYMRSIKRHPEHASEVLNFEITRLEDDCAFRRQHLGTIDDVATAQDSATH